MQTDPRRLTEKEATSLEKNTKTSVYKKIESNTHVNESISTKPNSRLKDGKQINTNAFQSSYQPLKIVKDTPVKQYSV